MPTPTVFQRILPGLLLLIFLGTGWTQDLDLSIPGLEEELPDAPSEAPAGEAASSGSVNLLDMIKAGGWSMWVLGAFSFGLIGLLIYSMIDLQKKNFQPAPLLEALRNDMEQGDLESASARLQPEENCLSAVMAAGFGYIGEKGFGILESDKLDEVMTHASKKFNRGRVRLINYFSVLAQAAPMMGLLGTVSGMIGAFAKLSDGGTGDPSAFAGNISEALITTASGLVIALPSIFCYFFFRDRLQSLVADCDDYAEDLTRRLRGAVAAYEQQGEEEA